MLEQWLRAIGLEDRLPAFLAERIALEDLPSLTDGDLRELGLSMGERRRFRRAILEHGIAKIPGAEPQSREPPAASLRRLVQSERRPLTVMFVDIVDSTGMFERIGDEAMLTVIRSYRALCGTAINRTGGRIAKYLGDGILAYFCYPIAHENDPERAVRAALEIAAGASSLQPGGDPPMAVRVGVATGSVILGDLFEGGEQELLAATGSPLNLAARLQTLAPAGGVVIAESTHDRVAGRFAFEDLGLRDLKGLPGPVRCWQVSAGLGTGGRGLEGGVTLPVRGREAEWRSLDSLWRTAVAGAGQAVVISGEAGVGKSALVGHFLRRSGVEPDHVVTLAGSDLDRDTPLFPVASYLRSSVLRRGRGMLGPPTNPAAALLARLAGLPFDTGLLEGLSAPQQRDRLLEAAADALLVGTRATPLCLVVEDLHWLDPSTLELLGRVLQRRKKLKLLLIMTTRDDFEAPWPADDLPAFLLLGRLGQSDVRAMAEDQLGTSDVPAALLERIVARTEGVPLFVQEVVRHIRQGFANPSLPDWTGDTDDVPSSLQEALMAQLDHVGPAKWVAQAASAIGRRVDRALLAEIIDMSAAELDDCLQTLTDGGVLREEDAAAGAYQFGHALLCDIAHGSLLRDARRTLHGRIADAMQRLEPDIRQMQPALMAVHLAEAEQFEDAARNWLEAARRAVAASALTEATRLLRRGLSAVERLGKSPGQVRLELELLGLLGPALMALNGHGAAETRAHYDRAYALSQTVTEDPAHFPLYWGWWRTAEHYPSAASRARWMLGQARAHRDTGVLLQAHHVNWASSFHLGHFGQCCEHIEAALQLYGDEDWRHHAPLYGNHDARVCAHGELSLVHLMQGRPDGGLGHHQNSRAWATQLRHLGSMTHSMDIALSFHAIRQSHVDAYNAAEEFIALTTEHGFRDHVARGQIYRGWARAMREDPAGGLQMLTDGFARQKDIGSSEDFPIYVSLLGEALIAAGQPDRAVSELVAARAEFDATGLRNLLPEVLRLTAAAMAASGAEEASLPVLAEAAQVVEEQGVPMLGLRIAYDRAVLMEKRASDVAAALLQAALAAMPARQGAEVSRAEALLSRLRAATGLPRAS